MSEPLVAALLAAVVAALGGLLAPRMIARLPEPEEGRAPDDTGERARGEDDSPVPDADAVAPPVPAKVPYAELAARPHLPAALAVASAAFAGAVGGRLGLDPALPLWVAVTVLGVTLSYVDWHTRLLPKRLVLPAYPVVLALALLAALLGRDTDVLLRVGVGWLVLSGAYALLWIVSPRGIGYGDVRLSGILAIALATLGWAELIVGGYAGFVLGAVGGVALAALGLVDRKAFPFGPFMMLGAWAGALWGSVLLRPWG
ncbi:prepilin peptidase [Mumia sp. DW29H23]|uniref:prepilin peptidase n=1 Tax=Mumia sp. DW29H23 TaxID=3421241 RepID=UPI003D686405